MTESWPEGVTFTIRSVALLLGVKPKTIYNTCWEQASRLSRPKYRQMRLRGPGDRRYYRVLTEADMRVIRSVFSVRVK